MKSPKSLRFAGAISAFSLVFSGTVIYRSLFQDPAHLQAQTLQLETFVPPQSDTFNGSYQTWARLPYFFVLGAWPTQFRGNPITYSLAYRPGLPQKFPASIRARWNTHVVLQIEAPHTPLENGKPYPSDEIMACLTSSWVKPAGQSFARCQEIRRKVLQPQVERVVEWGSQQLEIAWFHVANPHLPVAERSQGLYFKAKGPDKTLERYVLITPGGSQQGLMLLRPSQGDDGDLASMRLKQVVGSLQLQDQLNAGKALINTVLSKSQLPTASDMEDPMAYLTKLAYAQALLLAKISVDPKDATAYYHLGGTAYYMARFAANQRMRSTQIVSAQLLEILDNATETALPTLNSAWRYSKDLDPTSQYTSQLHQHWLELKKK